MILESLYVNFVAVSFVQVHDGTGSDDVKLLENAADYWISLASTLNGLEDSVIINIANEWHGSSGQVTHHCQHEGHTVLP